MEIVEIWPNLDENATQFIIFLPHYMSAETNKKSAPILYIEQF